MGGNSRCCTTRPYTILQPMEAMPVTGPSNARRRVFVQDDGFGRVTELVRGSALEILPRARAAGGDPESWEAEVVVIGTQPENVVAVRDLVNRMSTGAKTRVPVLVVTPCSTGVHRERMLEAGAADVVGDPTVRELELRVYRLADLHRSKRGADERVRKLEELMRERAAELEDARVQILERLARAAEYRDDDTGEHTRRVGALSGAIALELGMPPEEAEMVSRAAPLHDVGKIGISDGILLKPGRLTPKEVEVMRSHAMIGAQMLSGTDIPLLNLAATIALTHHEHWDGHGYPEGKSGGDIPLVGRIVAAADVFDALTTRRPYKDAWSIEETVAELEAERGRHLDPHVTDALLSLVDRNLLPPLIRKNLSAGRLN